MSYPILFRQRRERFGIFIFRALFVLLSLIATPVFAGDDIGNFDWHTPGDGKTPTVLQYLDTAKGTDVKEAAHLGMATSKGDLVYSYGLDLPPALLKPSLSLSYSSETEMGLEMPFGWSLNGIAEIRRPLTRGYKIDGPQHSRDYLLSGSGFSGVLKPSGNADGKFFLKSSEPTYVTAEYDETRNVWTVTHDALTFTLKEQDDGEGTTVGTAVWRVTEMKDSSGNAVDFTYASDGRLVRISYGGNAQVGKDHLIDVKFKYAANAAMRTNARAGFLTEYKRHVTLITVNSRESEGGTSKSSSTDRVLQNWDVSEDAESAIDASRLYAYDLVFTKKDSLDLLTKLEREGRTSQDAETVATFEYSAYDEDIDGDDRLDISGEAVRVNDKAPTSLGGFRQATSADGVSTDETTHSLMDFNRDGLPDVIDASASDIATTQKWQVTSQSVDDNARTLDWNGAETVTAIDATMGATITDKVDLTKSYNLSHATRELIDFDGDGYLDIVESGDVAKWTVSYGREVGLDFKAYAEALPDVNWTYSSESWRLNASHADAANVTQDLIKGLMDFNGDGWQDLYDPASGVVWLHSGTRGGGWDEKLEVASFEAMRSVKYTLAEKEFPAIDASDLCAEFASHGRIDVNANGVPSPMDADAQSELEGYNAAVSGMDESATADAAAALLQACEDMYSAMTIDGQMRIVYTFEFGSIRDLNGDGLQDYVDSSGATWRVYLNNGHGFEDAVSWSAPFAYAQVADATSVYQTLIDVDGDGLLDLARTKDLDTATTSKIWHRNTGSGFEEKSRDLPNWWPLSFKTTVSTNNVFDESTALSETMMDLDHDGVQDHVSIEITDVYDGSTGKFVDTSGENKVHFGAYPKPYLLKKIQNGQGGATEISYRSLATVSPSGDFTKKQYTPNVKNLVDVITSSDSLTGQNAETLFNYEDGHLDHGVFTGFGSRRVTSFINGSWTGSTQYAYELDHDFEPLVTTKELFTDSNLNFAPSLSGGAKVKALRFSVVNAYQDVGDHFHLLKKRQVTEFGESSSSKTVTHIYAWDDYGNPTTYTHDGGGVTEDAVTVSFEYVSNAASESDATFFRMKSKSVSGTNRLTSATQTVASEIYYYDGHTHKNAVLTDGLLTRAETQSGWLDGGESLDADTLAIAYTRGKRGELLSATDEATGITMAQTYGFGGAVLETQTNGLGHAITRTIDEQGRVDSMTDPNGLKIEFTFDAFNRVTQKKVTGTDGQTHVIQDSQYVRTSAPYYTMNRQFDETGAVDQTSYEIQDGFGHVTESWNQDENGHYLATKAITDLRGLVATTSHPKHRGTTFSLPTSSLSILNPLTQTYYDALGNPRESIRDAQKATGSQLIYFNKPWSELRQDEAGDQTRLTYDAHRRVTMVEQGKSNSFTTTATYRYDPLNRLVSFRDGKGTIYTYSYDGAGRLREVKYGGASSSGVAMTEWYKYDYKGMLQTQMRDNTGAIARREYDSLGRQTTLKVSDSLPSAAGFLSYAYEYDTAWKGKVYKTTDPAGTTMYKYDEFGREERVKREYAASSAGTQRAEFLYDTDLQGQLRIKTYPSGHRIKSQYAYGFLTSQTAMTSGATDYTLDFGYNQWGMTESIASSKGHQYTSTFTTPLWVDKLAMQYGSTTYETTYTWANNGLLTKRAENIGKGSAVYNYDYDSLRQLTQMATPTKTIETYTYDAAGNPLTMQDSDGIKWTYAAATATNQIASRTSSSGQTDTYTYDTAGRVKTWKSSKGKFEYYYDGLGRLRGVTKGGSWQMVLDYDADGNLVRRGDNNPYTSSPYYAYSFRDWRYDERTATTTENDSAVVSAVNGKRKWFFKGFDGHAQIVFNDAGTVQSQRALGAYGSVINSVGTTWDWNAFHGAEEQDELIHMGQRHLTQNDGMWLQPEPLLYQGALQDNLVDPLTVATRRYARNVPTVYADKTGYDPDNIANFPNINVVSQNRVDAVSPMQAAEDYFNETGDLDGTLQIIRDAVKDINPLGSMTNCVSASIATERTLSGSPAAAGDATSSGEPIVTGARSDAVEMIYQREFVQMGGWEDVVRTMTEAGSGAIAILDLPGHELNVANVGGNVILIDSQNGMVRVPEEDEGGWQELNLMVTTEPNGE